MVEDVVLIRVITPRRGRALRQTRYLVVTMKGAEFVEKQYTAEHIPSHLTRLYQLLLHLIWMRGTTTTTQAQRVGYSHTVLTRAISNGYVEVFNQPIRPSETIHSKISAMIGEAPRWIYA
jgi:hypothetical protein